MVLLTQYVMNAYQRGLVLATEETPNNSNKTDCFSYKGEWANV